MIQRVLQSKNFLAFALASGTGMYLYFAYPFPSSNLFLRAIAFRAPQIYEASFYSYTAMLFTTPFILFTILLSGLYIFTLRPGCRAKLTRLPLYPDPRLRPILSLVVGEVHNPRKPVPSANSIAVTSRSKTSSDSALWTQRLPTGCDDMSRTGRTFSSAAEREPAKRLS